MGERVFCGCSFRLMGLCVIIDIVLGTRMTFDELCVIVRPCVSTRRELALSRLIVRPTIVSVWTLVATKGARCVSEGGRTNLTGSAFGSFQHPFSNISVYKPDIHLFLLFRSSLPNPKLTSPRPTKRHPPPHTLLARCQTKGEQQLSKLWVLNVYMVYTLMC